MKFIRQTVSILIATLASQCAWGQSASCISGKLTSIQIQITGAPYVSGLSTGIYVLDAGKDASFLFEEGHSHMSEIFDNIYTEDFHFSSKKIRIFAFGPMLTAADSREIGLKINCARLGWTVQAYVHRSGLIDPNLRASNPWRPMLEIDVEPSISRSVIEINWTLRASTGGSLRSWSDRKQLERD